MKETTATIFTDGASRGNPGPGGWGSVVVRGSGAQAHVTERGGSERETTNNRMEISAAIGGLEAVPEGAQALVYTDSMYLIDGVTKWVKGWKRNGWQTRAKEDVLNRDLWETLDALASARRVRWEYVGGHVGVRGNERCDEIATGFADDGGAELYDGPLSGYSIPEVLDVSHDEVRAAAKESGSSHSRAKAYSYVSMVDRKIETHATWAECEARVKRVRGARYKKALNPADEARIKREFMEI